MTEGILSLLGQDAESVFLIDAQSRWTRREAAAEIKQRLTGPDGNVVALELTPTAIAIFDGLAALESGSVVAPLNLREPIDRRSEMRDRLERAPTPNGVAAAVLIRTSGTTSAGKWVLLDLDALLIGARRAAAALEFGPGDSWRMNLPLHHVGGLGPIWRALVSGGAIVLPAAEEGFTHTSLVATQLQRLLASDLPALHENCRRVLLGGGPVPPGLIEEAHRRGLVVHNSYGMTETGSLCVVDRRSIGSCELKTSAEGEILLRGAALFRGYLDLEAGGVHRPEIEGGWFPTGDLGSFEGGELQVFGRRDNQFISGGENIQPEEIERELMLLPNIEQAIVVGVPDQEFGMCPVAFVDQPSDELGRALEKRLPKYKIPIRFLRLPNAPDSGIKPDRRRLARQARESG